MSTGRLTVVAGLPGAGKSTVLREMQSSVSGLCVDDFHANAIGHSILVENSRYYLPLLEALRAGRDCVITDIAFCDPQRGSNLVRAISARIPSVDIKWIYFENVPERCRRNILRRAAQSLTSDLEMLDRFATVYRIPDGVTPRPVYGE